MQKNIYYCLYSILVLPITKNKSECVITNLKGKISAEYVVKVCAKFISGILMHIYNISFKSGILLGKFKIAIVKPS